MISDAPQPQREQQFEKEYVIVLDYAMFQTLLATLRSLGSPDIARHVEASARPHTPAPASELKEYIESVDLEFAKHFTYASGKEYEIWGTALNRIREIQSRLGVSENPCEDRGCTDIENCDEMCQHSRLFSPLQMQEAKEQAARTATLKENKRVLDEIRNTIKYEGVVGLIRKIESLRQQEGEQE